MKNGNYYPQGYLGKIAYHMFKGNFDKVQYFAKRQVDVYGDISEEDNRMIHRLISDLKLDALVAGRPGRR